MEEKMKKQLTVFKVISVVLCVALIIVSVCYIAGVGYKGSDTSQRSVVDKSITSSKSSDPLSLWNDSAKLKSELTSYVKDVTKEGGKDFIPVADRIAVFDFDGTLFNETDPYYFDFALYLYRVTEDPEYKDKASDFEKEVANRILAVVNGAKDDALMQDHGRAIATAFQGMTIDEFNEYVRKFMQMDMPSYTGLQRGDGFYKPMLQVIDYLEANDFKVFIVTGTDDIINRGLISNSTLLNTPMEQIIGSNQTIVGANQGDKDGLQYTLRDDKVVLGNEFIIKNLNMNKVSAIVQKIGKQPVLAFGNSSSDASMLNYAINNNNYKAGAYMLCCDDLDRENGNTSKAEKMVKESEENRWTPVSMKNDWKTIYGDGVTYKGAAK